MRDDYSEFFKAELNERVERKRKELTKKFADLLDKSDHIELNDIAIFLDNYKDLRGFLKLIKATARKDRL